MQVEQYYKSNDNTWLDLAYEDPQAIIRSPFLNVETTMEEIYEDVEFA